MIPIGNSEVDIAVVNSDDDDNNDDDKNSRKNLIRMEYFVFPYPYYNGGKKLMDKRQNLCESSISYNPSQKY